MLFAATHAMSEVRFMPGCNWSNCSSGSNTSDGFNGSTHFAGSPGAAASPFADAWAGRNVRRPAATNGLGIAGFIVSLAAIVFSAGLLSPIGLVLSFFGLFKRPRGLALAGFIIGLIGSAWLIAVLLIGVAAVAAVGVGAVVAAPHIEVAAEQQRLVSRLEAYMADPQGNRSPPFALSQLGLGDGAITDPWDKPYRYLISADGTTITIHSDGPDGIYDTDDDVRTEMNTPSRTPADEAMQTPRVQGVNDPV
jgi:hypothetical protein